MISDGVADEEVCRRLLISQQTFSRALKRIETRASAETNDAGRHYERALRIRTERKIASLSARFLALIDGLTHAVLVIDGRTGAIKEFNQTACELFGYNSDQLRSLTVEDLVPNEFRDVHSAYRIGFLSSIRRREMGYHPPIFGVKNDGTKVEMAISLTATTADDDVMVVCTERSSWDVAQAYARQRNPQ
jgi:PAS domain S-box-containing protein